MMVPPAPIWGDGTPEQAGDSLEVSREPWFHMRQPNAKYRAPLGTNNDRH